MTGPLLGIRWLVLALYALSFSCSDFSLGPAIPDPHPGQRIVVLGDSVAFALPARVPTAMMGLLDDGSVTAFTGNAGVPNSAPIKFTPEQSDFWSVRAQEPTGYAIEQDIGLGTVFTLPVGRIVEMNIEATQASAAIGELQFRSGWWSGWGRSFPQPGNRIAGRLHTRRPTAGDQECISTANNISALSAPLLPPPSSAGQISSPFQGVVDGPVPKFGLIDGTGEGGRLQVAGGTFWEIHAETHEWLPGVHFSSLADSSWSFQGFGADQAGVSEFDKTYSLAQLEAWLETSTIDPALDLTFMIHLASEPREVEELVESFTAIVDQNLSAAANIGLTGTVRNLFLFPARHRVVNDPQELEPGHFANHWEAISKVIAVRNNVSAVSLFNAFQGQRFDGSNSSLDWLTENGYQAFEFAGEVHDLTGDPWFGDLLDGNERHPRDAVSAAFFAERANRILGWDELGPRQSDVDGDGHVNFSDVLLVLNRWGTQNWLCDLDSDGTVGFSDILQVLLDWES